MELVRARAAETPGVRHPIARLCSTGIAAVTMVRRPCPRELGGGADRDACRGDVEANFDPLPYDQGAARPARRRPGHRRSPRCILPGRSARWSRPPGGWPPGQRRPRPPGKPAEATHIQLSQQRAGARQRPEAVEPRPAPALGSRTRGRRIPCPGAPAARAGGLPR